VAERAPDTAAAWSTQQLTGFLALVSSAEDEYAASVIAVQRTAEALQAELAALVREREVVAAVGCPADAVLERALIDVVAGEAGTIAAPGLGECPALSIPIEDDAPGTAIVIARRAGSGFAPEELHLARGMARVLGLSLRLFRLAAGERRQRDEAETQALLNQRLLESLQERQGLLERLSQIQRSIASGAPGDEVFTAICEGARELLGDELVGLRLIPPDDPDALELVAVAGPGADELRGQRIPIGEGLGGRALAESRLVATEDCQASELGLRECRERGLCSGMATPVHERGRAVGSLVVASYERGRRYTATERDMLIALADHASVVLNSREATERRQLEAQLRQAQRLESVGQLAGGVAHDFNNLLSVIRGYANFLEDALPHDSPLRDDAGEISKAAERAARLTNQLLVFSRRDVVRSRVLDLGELLTGMTTLLERTVGRTVALHTEVASGLWRVEVDPSQIEQVLMNLAVNARDAMTGGGRLELQLENVELDDQEARSRAVESGRYVRLRVCDSGPGMPLEVAERAFEPFFTTKPKGQGTGLGLATVYGIVTQADGSVTISSSPGGGATLEVLLPATGAELEADVEGGAERPPVASEPARGETILVVEDDDAVRRLTRRILARAGYTVIEAPGAAAALAAWQAHDGEIDLLLTDVVMPDVSGKELADRLGVEPLFMSGYTADMVLRLGVDAEEPRLVHKPFEAQTLLSAVRGALDGTSASP
jgi:signal transduction histidine kinase/CheY-like chemotaxis protein